LKIIHKHFKVFELFEPKIENDEILGRWKFKTKNKVQYFRHLRDVRNHIEIVLIDQEFDKILDE